MLYDQHPEIPDVKEEIKRSLSQPQKSIPPKYFYDETGSRLFEQITHTQEYYLTRSEIEILRTERNSIAAAIGDTDCLIEYGSGFSQKIQLLFDVIRPNTYVPVDISRIPLLRSATAVSQAYEHLRVLPVCADYTKVFLLPEEVKGSIFTAFFPGSSIGNFHRSEAIQFFQAICKVLGPGGRLILGVDKRKSAATIEAAYNDRQGITEAFNLNILDHLNVILGSDFDPFGFSHVAKYSSDLGRVEIFLRSKCAQQVQIDDQIIALERDELIHTEYSYKYSVDELSDLALQGGLTCTQIWEDQKHYFMVALLEVN